MTQLSNFEETGTSRVNWGIPVAVAADKVDLVLAAFLKHHLQVFDRMRTSHFREEFGGQVRFGSRPIQYLIAGERNFLKHRLLRTEHKIQGAPVCAGQRGYGRRLYRFVRVEVLLQLLAPRHGHPQCRNLTILHRLLICRW